MQQAQPDAPTLDLGHANLLIDIALPDIYGKLRIAAGPSARALWVGQARSFVRSCVSVLSCLGLRWLYG